MRSSADGSQPASGDDDPDERTLYTYDASWNLLEERVESRYAGPWLWGGQDLEFSTQPSSSTLTHEYAWDPTSQDELVLFRDGGIDGEDYFALTDHRRDVVALVPTDGDVSGIQRVRYSAYGVAEPQLLGDIDADGDVDQDDVAFLVPLVGQDLDDITGGGDPTAIEYRADADLNLDGVIDNADLVILTAAMGSSAPDLWTLPCSVGYAAGMHEPVLDLWLFRNRWYDSENGKWLTRDPAGYIDGLNLHQYVSGNPYSYWDPFGLEKCFIDRAMDFLGILPGNVQKKPIRDPGKAEHSDPPAELTEAINQVEAASDVIEPIADAVIATETAAAAVGAGFVPGVGQGMDGEVLFNSDSSPLERGIAGTSLTIDTVFGGALPNFGAAAGAFGKLVRKNADKVTDLSTSQKANIKRFEKKTPNAETSILHEMPNGGVAVQREVAGNVPGSKAVYEKQIDSGGITTQVTKTTLDPKGVIVHVKDKMPK